MITNTHMQDQIHNRIEDLMNEHDNQSDPNFNWDEVIQSAATFSLIIVFLTIGLSW